MPHDPPVAARILRAFERAASEPDPVFPFSEGFTLVLRHHSRGVLSYTGCGEIARSVLRARAVLEPHLPAIFGAERLRMGTDALGELLVAWTMPVGDPDRHEPNTALNHLQVRIVANDLDSICASIELMRGSATRPSVPMAAQPSASTLLN